MTVVVLHHRWHPVHDDHNTFHTQSAQQSHTHHQNHSVHYNQNSTGNCHNSHHSHKPNTQNIILINRTIQNTNRFMVRHTRGDHINRFSQKRYIWANVKITRFITSKTVRPIVTTIRNTSRNTNRVATNITPPAMLPARSARDTTPAFASDATPMVT